MSTVADTPADRIAQDFQRDVYCLFGLPVDNLTMESTKVLLRKRVQQPGSTVLSTININLVVQSLKDPAFRSAIINSDIVTLDGKPLLWLAKGLGYPMTETVPGSTLIQELHQDKSTQKPLTLFLFGGEEGAARKALERINSDQGGLRAVGALNPGFGTVEEMSTTEIIAAINRTEPDILLVALGAKKGTQWIEHNRDRLNAKIISHLGATINFLAGTVKRAPKLVRSIGMEWVWRILQEPKLFTRYASDGLVMLRVLAARFYPWLQYLYLKRRYSKEPVDESVQQIEDEKQITLSFGRNIRVTKDSPIREVFVKSVASTKNIILEFKQTKFVDGAFMGLILILFVNQQRINKRLIFVKDSGLLVKFFRFLGVQESIQTINVDQ